MQIWKKSGYKKITANPKATQNVMEERENEDPMIRSGCWMEIFLFDQNSLAITDHINFSLRRKVIGQSWAGKIISTLYLWACLLVWRWSIFSSRRSKLLECYLLWSWIRIWNWWHHRSQSPRARACVCKYWPKIFHMLFLQAIANRH